MFFTRMAVLCSKPAQHSRPRGREFLDEILTKVLRDFLLAIRSHLYSFPLRFYFFKLTQPPMYFFKLTQPLTYFYSSVTLHRKEERRKT